MKWGYASELRKRINQKIVGTSKVEAKRKLLKESNEISIEWL